MRRCRIHSSSVPQFRHGFRSGAEATSHPVPPLGGLSGGSGKISPSISCRAILHNLKGLGDSPQLASGNNALLGNPGNPGNPEVLLGERMHKYDGFSSAFFFDFQRVITRIISEVSTVSQVITVLTQWITRSDSCYVNRNAHHTVDPYNLGFKLVGSCAFQILETFPTVQTKKKSWNIHSCPVYFSRTYTYVYIHTYIHTYIHRCIHRCIHTYIHTYMHTYIHTYIHTYTCKHTYIHTCKLTKQNIT